MNPKNQTNDPSEEPDTLNQPNTTEAESKTESTPTVDAVETPTSTTPVATHEPVVTSAEPAATSTGTPSAPKKSNTKTIIIISSIVGGLLLLGVIGAILYSLFMTVSQKDYRDAATQYNVVSSKSSVLSSKITSLSSSLSADDDSKFDSGIKDAEDAIADIKTENKKLGELKAVRVGEGKELYKTFDGKVATYLTYGTGLLDSLKKIHPALMDCDEISGAVSNADKLSAIQKCSSTLDKTGELPNREFDEYIKSMNKAYAIYATDFEKMTKLSAPFGAQYSEYQSLRNEILDAQKDVTTARTDFVSGLKKHDEEVSVKASANALKDYLNAQQNK